jgi:tetratricopeptide (TPR) repeat protein
LIDVLNLLQRKNYLSTGTNLEEKIKDFNIPYGFHLILKLQYNYLLNNFNEAFIHSEKAERLIPEMLGLFISSEFIFYQSLTLFAMISSSGIATRETFLKKINENQTKMKIWAGRCPENFLHKYLLVEAELAFMNGDVASAMDFYKKSIESAAEQGYVQNEALANELAGRFWLKRGESDFALLHLPRARSGYKAWGAESKVRLLDDEFPALKKNRSNVSGPADVWDIRDRGNTALVKSLQAISGEIELESLLCILIKNMLQYEGGTRIAIIIEKKGSLFIEAEGYVDQLNGEIKSMLHKSVPVDECKDNTCPFK